jgi:hypothetical protein
VLKTSRLKRGSEELNQILTHEISHLILGSVSDSSMIPKWFDEGLAVYVSHQWGFWESILISGAILGKALIPLDEIEYQFPEKSFKAGLAYAEGYTVINFIINRFGQNRLKNILIELKKGSDFYKALETSLQINQDLFQTEWKNFIFQQYKWIYVINNSQLFWIFLCLLFIIAYVRKRITSRRKFENLDKLP